MSRWACPSCGYVYDEQAGDRHEGFAPGTPWSDVPDDWACPDCGVRDKLDFEPVEDSEEGIAPVSYREATRLLLRDTVLDAIRRLLGERAWAQLTMAEVASAAGISRQTLYNEFGSREQLGQAFVIREGERFIAAVERAIETHLDDPTSALAAALETFLQSAARDPLIAMLLADDGTGGMLPLLTTQSGPVLGWASARIAAAMRRGWPQMDADDARLLAEALVRLAISYVTAPAGPPRQASADAVRLLEPFIAQATSRATLSPAR